MASQCALAQLHEFTLLDVAITSCVRLHPDLTILKLKTTLSTRAVIDLRQSTLDTIRDSPFDTGTGLIRPNQAKSSLRLPRGGHDHFGR